MRMTINQKGIVLPMVLIIGLILTASVFSFLLRRLVGSSQASGGLAANQQGADGESSKDGSDPN